MMVVGCKCSCTLPPQLDTSALEQQQIIEVVYDYHSSSAKLSTPFRGFRYYQVLRSFITELVESVEGSTQP